MHHADSDKDDAMMMGSGSLFIEHPTDRSNRLNLKGVKKECLPWADVDKLPYTITGPLLKQLFDRAFIEGLHQPHLRPTADDWEQALVKTVDLLQPCVNPACAQKWYVFDNSTRPSCPFCSTPYRGELPVLNLYSSRGKGQFLPDNHRLMVFTNQYLYPWHVNRMVFPNEKLTDDQRKPVGYFVLHGGRWVFVNQRLPDMKDVDEDKPVPIGTMVELADGKKFLLAGGEGGRLIHVQMVRT